MVLFVEGGYTQTGGEIDPRGLTNHRKILLFGWVGKDNDTSLPQFGVHREKRGTWIHIITTTLYFSNDDAESVVQSTQSNQTKAKHNDTSKQAFRERKTILWCHIVTTRVCNFGAVVTDSYYYYLPLEYHPFDLPNECVRCPTQKSED